MLSNVPIKSGTRLIHQINCTVYGIIQRQALSAGTGGNSFKQSLHGIVKSCNCRAEQFFQPLSAGAPHNSNPAPPNAGSGIPDATVSDLCELRQVMLSPKRFRF
ncbi:MAG TPA: hypothetical protein VKE70_07040 [Candidatus Solibacter sp.]|nr:hypothetical protein [Candidatus Solibacter sp.]